MVAQLQQNKAADKNRVEEVGDDDKNRVEEVGDDASSPPCLIMLSQLFFLLAVNTPKAASAALSATRGGRSIPQTDAQDGALPV